MVLGTGFGLARMKNGGFGVKGSKLGSVTSRHQVHESSTLAFYHESSPSARVVTISFCHESSPSVESSTLQFLQRVTTFQLWAVIVFWPQLRLYISKLSDSSCFGKITQSNTTFMKKSSWEKVVWMDENALEPDAYAWMVTFGDWMVSFQV